MAEFLTIELLTFNCRQMRYCTRHIYAGMAELADALDLGSSGRPCRFKSCYPHDSIEKCIEKGDYSFEFTRQRICLLFRIHGERRGTSDASRHLYALRG